MAEYQAPKGAQSTGSVQAGGKSLDYQASAGWMVISHHDQPTAEIFHVAYHLATDEPRPLTFLFNGGPGAASAFLHMGVVGPQRIAFTPDGRAPAAPVPVVDNAETWLAWTDLVFVDPVGTGFSRAVPAPAQEGEKQTEAERTDAANKDFFKLNRDLQTLCEFADRYLSENRLWGRPVAIAGESYGGFRVGRLANMMQQDYGITLSAAILISPALEFSALGFENHDYDVLPFVDVFPSMAAAAAFHGRSRVFDPQTPRTQVLAEAESFATSALAQLLVQGDTATDRFRSRTLNRAASLLGLPRGVVEAAGGRIGMGVFSHRLLHDAGLVLGRYDATITGRDPYPDRERYEGPDPTLTGIDGAFRSAVNHQLRREIGLETPRRYELLSRVAGPSWQVDYEKHVLQTGIGATDDLRFGISLNPHMKVLISHGVFDLVTPYFSSNRIVANMKLDEASRSRVTLEHYGGGHMFYTWEESRLAFARRVQAVYGA